MAGDTDSADESNLTREPAVGEGRDATPAHDGAPAASDAPQCMPCRGTGTVVSNLGGTSSTVSCPWCGGTGVRRQGIDAQERWREHEGASSPSDP
jgi:hypothetical protein